MPVSPNKRDPNSHEKKAKRIAILLAGYMRETLTPGEHDELDEWVGASDKNMRLFEELTDKKRVQLALDLLNDHQGSALANKLMNDQEYVYTNRHFHFGSIQVKLLIGLLILVVFFISQYHPIIVGVLSWFIVERIWELKQSKYA